MDQIFVENGSRASGGQRWGTLESNVDQIKSLQGSRECCPLLFVFHYEGIIGLNHSRQIKYNKVK